MVTGKTSSQVTFRFYKTSKNSYGSVRFGSVAALSEGRLDFRPGDLLCWPDRQLSAKSGRSVITLFALGYSIIYRGRNGIFAT